jgi:uncharacterized protein
MKKLYIRFYEELNDFLPDEKKKKRSEHKFTGSPSIKDLIESLGVPHVEVDLILVNGVSVDFKYRVKSEDDISVYPVFESLDISGLQHLRAQPLRDKKFILDVHLGALAKYLRMLGFDAKYENNYSDVEIVKISLEEKRTILTKDRGILKRNEVDHAYFVRNKFPGKQIEEVLNRFDLKNSVREFSRCMECNSVLEQKNKEDIVHLLPEKVKANQEEFYYCNSCRKAYWKGSHYIKMKDHIEKILSPR